MSETKKAKYNEVYIAGEVVSISNMDVKNKGEDNERESYRMIIEVAPEENVTVTFDNNVWNQDGTESTKAAGAMTIFKEVKQKVKDGQGDMVRVNGKLTNNTYYKDGKLTDFTVIKVDYCNRQKDGETITPDQVWKADMYIKEIENKEDHIALRGLIYDYTTKTGNVIGYNVPVRVYDENIKAIFEEVYKVGAVAKLEGRFREIVTTEEVAPQRRTIGKVRETKPKFSIERWIEVEGGEEAINITYDNDGNMGDFIEIKEGHPFAKESLDKMDSRLEEALSKSKERDDEKMAKTKQLDDSNCPF